MKMETIYRKLNALYTIRKNNHYMASGIMHGTIAVVDGVSFSYTIQLEDFRKENDCLVMNIDCAKYDIHIENCFYEFQQTVGSIVDEVAMHIYNMKKILLAFSYIA